MNKSNVYLWLLELLSQFLEGISDNFLASVTGSTVAGFASGQVSLSVKTVLLTTLATGAIYVAAFIRKNPRPWAYLPPADQSVALTAVLSAAEPIKPAPSSS